jgi:hypothetical protein
MAQVARIGRLTLIPSVLTHAIIHGGIFVTSVALEHQAILTKQIISGVANQAN